MLSAFDNDMSGTLGVLTGQEQGDTKQIANYCRRILSPIISFPPIREAFFPVVLEPMRYLHL